MTYITTSFQKESECLLLSIRLFSTKDHTTMSTSAIEIEKKKSTNFIMPCSLYSNTCHRTS